MSPRCRPSFLPFSRPEYQKHEALAVFTAEETFNHVTLPEFGREPFRILQKRSIFVITARASIQLDSSYEDQAIIIAPTDTKYLYNSRLL